MIYGFIGMGLMGGSLAKAVRKYAVTENDKIYGYDMCKSVLEDAMLDGTLDAMFIATDNVEYDSIKKMLAECDLVYVCLYPEATLAFILAHQNDFKSGSIITDIAGVKQKLCAGLDTYFTRSDVTVIPGHPMAGSEREGYTHSSGEIFKGRNYIFITSNNNTLPESNKIEVDQNKLEVLKSLARKIGFTNIIETTPQNHDHKITFTSQLCHVIASALVDSAEDTSITDFGGGSFEDLTRIAMINASLWSELFTADKKELLGHIENFERSLDILKKTIKNDDCENMKKMLENVRKKRIEMATH
jgi:prephenate dehydrogenase